MAPAVAARAVADGFDGGGQVVEPVVDQLPESVEHRAFLVGVMAVVEPVLADEVVVLGLDRGLVVLLVRSRPGEEDLRLAGPLYDGLIGLY
jgi:hypothetical protein